MQSEKIGAIEFSEVADQSGGMDEDEQYNELKYLKDENDQYGGSKYIKEENELQDEDDQYGGEEENELQDDEDDQYGGEEENEWKENELKENELKENEWKENEWKENEWKENELKENEWKENEWKEDDQYGGEDENELKDNTYDMKKVDEYEKDLYDIFNNAKKYRQQVVTMQNGLTGGQTKPSGRGSAFTALVEVAKKIRSTGKVNDFKFKDIIKLAKSVYDDAKKSVKPDEQKDVEKVKAIALKLAENPDEYIKKFKEQQMKTSVP